MSPTIPDNENLVSKGEVVNLQEKIRELNRRMVVDIDARDAKILRLRAKKEQVKKEGQRLGATGFVVGGFTMIAFFSVAKMFFPTPMAALVASGFFSIVGIAQCQ